MWFISMWPVRWLPGKSELQIRGDLKNDENDKWNEEDGSSSGRERQEQSISQSLKKGPHFVQSIELLWFKKKKK